MTTCTLTLCLLLLYADKLCKQFASKLFDTLKVLLKEFFEKDGFRKKSADDKMHEILQSMQRLACYCIGQLYTVFQVALEFWVWFGNFFYFEYPQYML